MDKKGFTLIEILAVITIVSVLMVIIVPNIVKSMHASRMSALKSFGSKMFDEAESRLEAERLAGNVTIGTDLDGSIFEDKTNYGNLASTDFGLSSNSSQIMYMSNTNYTFPDGMYYQVYAVPVSKLAPDQDKYRGCVLLLALDYDFNRFDMVLFLYDGEYMLNGVMKKDLRSATVVPDTIKPTTDQEIIDDIPAYEPNLDA